MENLSEEQLLEGLKAQEGKAYEEYTSIERQFLKAKDKLNRLRVAIEALTGEYIPDSKIHFTEKREIKELPGIAEESIGTEVQENDTFYNKEWPISHKALFAIKTEGTALGRHAISDFIHKREPELNSNKLELAVSGELHKMRKNNEIGGGKPRGSKMKGFLFGHTSWFDEEGYVKSEYLPKSSPEKESERIWQLEIE